MTRDGRRSTHTALSRAVQTELAEAVSASPLKSLYGVNKQLEEISKSQLYAVVNGDAVVDMVELDQICSVLGIDPSEIVARAEARVAAAIAFQTGAADELARRRTERPQRTYPQPVKRSARKPYKPRPGD